MTNEIIKRVKALQEEWEKLDTDLPEYERNLKQFQFNVLLYYPDIAQALLEIYNENELLKVVDLYYDMAMEENKKLKEDNLVFMKGCVSASVSSTKNAEGRRKAEEDLKICVEVLEEILDRKKDGTQGNKWWEMCYDTVYDALAKISSNNLV